MFRNKRNVEPETPDVPKPPSETPYARILREQGEERDSARQKRETQNTIDLATAVAGDEKERVAARSFRPNVRIKKYEAGDFLCYDKLEVPRKYIEGIEVGRKGRAPHIDWSMGLIDGYSFVAIGRASISVTKVSGQVHSIDCSRHELDILLDALCTAWKKGKA